MYVHRAITYNILVGVDEPVDQSKHSLQASMSDGQNGESLASISRVEGVVLLLQQLAAACHAQQAGPQTNITIVVLTQQLTPPAVSRDIAVGACLLTQTMHQCIVSHSTRVQANSRMHRCRNIAAQT